MLTNLIDKTIKNRRDLILLTNNKQTIEAIKEDGTLFRYENKEDREQMYINNSKVEKVKFMKALLKKKEKENKINKAINTIAKSINNVSRKVMDATNTKA